MHLLVRTMGGVALFVTTVFAETPSASTSPTTAPSTTIAPPVASAIASPTPTENGFPTTDASYQNQFQIMNTKKLSGRIAFTATIDGYDRLLVLDLDAGKVRKLVDGPGNNSYPTWSPDGNLVTFTSDRDGNREIYVALWDGSLQRRLTNNSVVDDNPTFGARGKTVVYSQDSKVGKEVDSNVFLYNLDKGTAQQFTFLKQRNTTPRVSPDGKILAYSTNRHWPGWDVCFFRPGEKSETCPLKGALSFCRPAWSPSGKLLAYSVGTLDQIDIGVLNLETGAQTIITDMQGKEYDPVWSPSEGLVAFVGESGSPGKFNIYVADLQGTTSQILRSPHSIRYLSWSGKRTFELEAARIREQELEELGFFQTTPTPTAAATAPTP